MVVIKVADERLLPRLELVLDRLILKEKIRYIYVGVVALTWSLHRCQAYEAEVSLSRAHIIPLNAPPRLPAGLMDIQSGWAGLLCSPRSQLFVKRSKYTQKSESDGNCAR